MDEENTQLSKRQAGKTIFSGETIIRISLVRNLINYFHFFLNIIAFQRTREHNEGADEEFEKFCQEAMFRIQILEQRLQRHEER